MLEALTVEAKQFVPSVGSQLSNGATILKMALVGRCWIYLAKWDNKMVTWLAPESRPDDTNLGHYFCHICEAKHDFIKRIKEQCERIS